MDKAVLYAPWRMEYIRGLIKPAADQGCFICDAGAATTDEQRRQRLVLWTTPTVVVLMNRYPYANGHLLVAPRAHKADPEELVADEQLELFQEVTAGVKLLRRAVSAQGFNVGLNLGRCAGAGVPGHLHWHIVPRWGGDINYMGIIGEVRVIPEAMSKLYNELLRVRGEIQRESEQGK
jgi:ATP adenylyltransferase